MKQSNSDTAQGASVLTGNNVSIGSGEGTPLESTQAKTGDSTVVSAGGVVMVEDAVSTSSSLELGGLLAGKASKESTIPAKPTAGT